MVMKKKYARFEKFLFIKKGLQPITVGGHIRMVVIILRKMGTQNPSKNQWENYVLELYKSAYSYSYKANQVKSIEYWTEFLGKPLRFGRQKKPSPIIKDTLTEAEVTKLLFNCRNSRESAIISTLAYSGLRNKELCKLKVKDIDAGNNTVRVIQGKNFKDRIVYISGHCTKLILKYLVEYPRSEDSYLFTILRTGKPYNGIALRKLVRVLGKRAKLQKRIYPYLLRHSLATNMLGRGANILTIKKQLGHAWIDTTMLYLHSIGYAVKNEYDQFAPSYV